MMQVVQTMLFLSPLYTRRVTYAAVAVVFAVVALFPGQTQAFASVLPMDLPAIAAISELAHEPRELPQAGERLPSRSTTIPVTAYSSDPWQTDDTPFHTADGTYVRDGLIAANFLPLGTRVRFPDLYGDKVFIVKDRMNARYWRRADIWMPATDQARQFGIRYTTMDIF